MDNQTRFNDASAIATIIFENHSIEWMIPFFKMKSFRPFLCEKIL